MMTSRDLAIMAIVLVAIGAAIGGGLFWVLS
jgi:L-asparagine transporter-like permease